MEGLGIARFPVQPLQSSSPLVFLVEGSRLRSQEVLAFGLEFGLKSGVDSQRIAEVTGPKNKGHLGEIRGVLH